MSSMSSESVVVASVSSKMSSSNPMLAPAVLFGSVTNVEYYTTSCVRMNLELVLNRNRSVSS